MVDLDKLKEEVLDAIGERNNKWIVFLRAISSDFQFEARREIFLNELSRVGLKKDVEVLFVKTSIELMIEDSDDLDSDLPF